MSENNEVTREELETIIGRYDNFYSSEHVRIQHLDPARVADSLLENFVITRKPALLPSEPDSLWLDKDGDVWKVTVFGILESISCQAYTSPHDYAPFRRLVVAE